MKNWIPAFAGMTNHIIRQGVPLRKSGHLVDWLKSVAAPKYFTINIIPYNQTDREYKAPAKERVEAFSNLLLTLNASVTVRKSLGSDIAGACGQLAGK